MYYVSIILLIMREIKSGCLNLYGKKQGITVKEPLIKKYIGITVKDYPTLSLYLQYGKSEDTQRNSYGV